MKCVKCGHLVMEGYEYPEYYCELGIADNPKYEKYDTGIGCTVPKNKRIKLCKELNNSEYAHGLWWDESDIDLMKTVKKVPFWKRENYWKTEYEKRVLDEIINPINEKIIN